MRLASSLCLVCVSLVAFHGELRGQQAWELALRRVIIDHDYDGPISSQVEQIPAGFGISGRHVWGSGVFLGLEMSRAAEAHQGAVCGGFIYDPSTQCIPETVVQSGGLVAFLAGIRWRWAVSSSWSIGLAPRAGAGALWTRETGKDTKRTLGHSPFTVLLGAEAELSYALPRRGVRLLSSIGADRLRPLAIIEEDGWQPLRNPMPQFFISVGVGWNR